MKWSIVRQKPNVKRRNLYSDALNKKFKLFISNKARKCIMKAGSFDKYLTNTKPAHIDSKFGLHLREIIKQKQKNPDLEIGYIPGTSS